MRWEDLLMDEWFTDTSRIELAYLRSVVPKERVYVSDCLSKTHNRGTVPGLLPPVPDGHVDYSVWVEWRRNGAGWSRMLYAITVGADLLEETA